MFRGYFARPEIGLCSFWGKELGSINSQKYCERIVVPIDGMVSMRPWLSVMQYNASARAAARTMEDVNQRLIQPIFWPTNSPDLNPIEAFWDSKKD
ncbi:unnamed protein product [Blumeria hordei]|uniref:Tc1-like transposase DDE domain-containing protein n=1 Tax=Blumeria hordei TaxID=2867405 RepID=A0A383UHN8_BLUHO|nr:unnamed protein product [Blumeria hordei]